MNQYGDGSVTRVTHTSYFKRIINSFIGVLFGIALFFGSFYLLYWNEGRVNLATIAEKAVTVNEITSPDSLVYITDITSTGQVIGDMPILADGNYLAIKKEVAMYSWKEKKETSQKRNVGGSETTTTTYRYYKDWAENPANSSIFENPTGHENPAMLIKSKTINARDIKIGNYQIKGNPILGNNYQAINPNDANINVPEGWSVAGEWITNSKQVSMPEVGDVRFLYKVVPVGGTVTLFGSITNNQEIVPHFGEHGNSLFRMFLGNKYEAIKTLNNEYLLWKWICRIAGFFMMWIGMNLVIGPLSVLLDILPFLGTVGRSISSMLTFPIALVLTILTILVSMALHNFVAIVLIGVISLLITVSFLRSRTVHKDGLVYDNERGVSPPPPPSYS